MNKVLEGVVVSTKMNKTVIVEVVRRTAHPLYKKLIRKSKKYKVDAAGLTVSIGDRVKMVGTRPISKDKYFKIKEVLTTEGAKKKETNEKVSKVSQPKADGLLAQKAKKSEEKETVKNRRGKK